MRIAIVGTGYVADYYMTTLARYPELELVGAYDQRDDALAHFGAAHGVSGYRSLDDLLADNADIVVNLTNPRSHFEVTKRALEAGKHVYSEKPLSMFLEEAEELVALAERNSLVLSGAPCSLLGETAQTLWKSLREETVGKAYLAYAEMDDGLVPRMPYAGWLSATGVPWPWKDEFETGCTLEHAGYYLTWFPAFFGPATSVTAFSTTLVDDKFTSEALTPNGPDFSVACITFANGVVVRLTCSIVGEHDHSLRIFGEKGTLSIHDSWFYNSPVKLQRQFNVRRRRVTTPKLPVKLVGSAEKYGYRGAQQMDFARGIAELAQSIDEKRQCRLSARYALHVNELVLAIHHAGVHGGTHEVRSRFDPIDPMPWAK